MREAGVCEHGEPDLWCALALEKVLSHTQELPGAWVQGQSAGGCRNNSGFPSNPKFWLRVSEPSEVYIAVLQRPRMRTVDWAGRAQVPVGGSRIEWSPASIPGKDYPAVGLHLWKVTPLGKLPLTEVQGPRWEARGCLNPRSCSAGTRMTDKSPTGLPSCPVCPRDHVSAGAPTDLTLRGLDSRSGSQTGF